MKESKKRLMPLLVLISVLAIGGALGLKYGGYFQSVPQRTYVADQMKDPESVKFRNEKFEYPAWLCGEINAKNSMGGYTGFKRFISRAPDAVYLEEEGYVGTGPENIEYDTILSERLDEMLKDSIENARRQDQGLPTLTRFERKWRQWCE